LVAAGILPAGEPGFQPGGVPFLFPSPTLGEGVIVVVLPEIFIW
jgi:hypothetical protein